MPYIMEMIGNALAKLEEAKIDIDSSAKKLLKL